MARRYLGSATTNAQGVATLTYTGVGAGKVDIVAESEGLLSSAYTITDCLRLDRGVSGTGNYTDLFNNMGYFTRESDGTTVASGTASTEPKLSSDVTMDSEYAVEFELLSCTYCNFRIFRINSSNQTKYYGNIPITGTGLVKIEVLQNSIKAMLDNTVLATQSVTEGYDSKFNFTFKPYYDSTTETGGLNFKYKNLAIYPI